MGDCGWGEGQLQDEISGGTWLVVRPSTEFLALFGAGSSLDASSAELDPSRYEHDHWQRYLQGLGGEYAAMATLPPGIWQDIYRLEV